MSSSATEDLAVKAKELKESMDVISKGLKKYSETFEMFLKTTFHKSENKNPES